LSRKAYNEIPPRVDYELTTRGKDLGKLFDELRAWSNKYQIMDRPRGQSRKRPN